MQEKTEADSVEALVRKGAVAKRMDIERGNATSAEVLLVPKGNGAMEAISVKPFLDAYLDKPERRTGTARITDLDSFVEHVNRFKGDDSVLFAVDTDPKTPKLVCVYDYNPKGGDTTNAAFAKHRAEYQFPMSDEWKAWNDANADEMDQQEFAEFIENRIADVVDPSRAGENAKAFAATLGCAFATPSKLLELSRGLSVRVGQSIRNHQNLSTGEAQMQFESTHTNETGGPLKVPGAFLVGLPIFRNGVVYQIAARLRYRVSGGSVSWFFELYRLDAALDDAIREVCNTAESATTLPLFHGQPESN